MLLFFFPSLTDTSLPISSPFDSKELSDSTAPKECAPSRPYHGIAVLLAAGTEWLSASPRSQKLHGVGWRLSSADFLLMPITSFRGNTTGGFGIIIHAEKSAISQHMRCLHSDEFLFDAAKRGKSTRRNMLYFWENFLEIATTVPQPQRSGRRQQESQTNSRSSIDKNMCASYHGRKISAFKVLIVGKLISSQLGKTAAFLEAGQFRPRDLIAPEKFRGGFGNHHEIYRSEATKIVVRP